MSWETFVVGTLEIAPDVPKEKKAKIVDDFEQVLETDAIWDDQYKEYKVSHINWMSHVREEDIKECYQRHKRHIKRISLSLWYLSEADFTLHVDRSEYEQRLGAWYPRNSQRTVPALDYLFGTLMPPGRTAAEVG